MGPVCSRFMAACQWFSRNLSERQELPTFGPCWRGGRPPLVMKLAGDPVGVLPVLPGKYELHQRAAGACVQPVYGRLPVVFSKPVKTPRTAYIWAVLEGRAAAARHETRWGPCGGPARAAWQV